MCMTDTVADLLTRIRNALQANHRYVDVIYSRFNKEIINVLKEKGFLKDVMVDTSRRKIRIYLKYKAKFHPVIHELVRVSKPGCRRYVNKNQIPSIKRGVGTVIMSTSQGVIDGESARKNNVGGEYLAYVW